MRCDPTTPVIGDEVLSFQGRHAALEGGMGKAGDFFENDPGGEDKISGAEGARKFLAHYGEREVKMPFMVPEFPEGVICEYEA